MHSRSTSATVTATTPSALTPASASSAASSTSSTSSTSTSSTSASSTTSTSSSSSTHHTRAASASTPLSFTGLKRIASSDAASAPTIQNQLHAHHKKSFSLSGVLKRLGLKKTSLEKSKETFPSTFADGLADVYWRAQFRAFLEKEFSSENLEFYEAVESFKEHFSTQDRITDKVMMLRDARILFAMFISTKAPCQINLPDTVFKVLVDGLGVAPNVSASQVMAGDYLAKGPDFSNTISELSEQEVLEKAEMEAGKPENLSSMWEEEYIQKILGQDTPAQLAQSWEDEFLQRSMTPHFFDEAIKEIIKLISSDSWRRFANSHPLNIAKAQAASSSSAQPISPKPTNNPVSPKPKSSASSSLASGCLAGPPVDDDTSFSSLDQFDDSAVQMDKLKLSVELNLSANRRSSLVLSFKNKDSASKS